ncbi:hypothetical protein GCM10020229_00900 [Kitasatospora albolonga]
MRPPLFFYYSRVPAMSERESMCTAPYRQTVPDLQDTGWTGGGGDIPTLWTPAALMARCPPDPGCSTRKIY